MPSLARLALESHLKEPMVSQPFVLRVHIAPLSSLLLASSSLIIAATANTSLVTDQNLGIWQILLTARTAS